MPPAEKSPADRGRGRSLPPLSSAANRVPADLTAPSQICLEARMKALTVDFVLITQSMRDLSRIANDYFLDRSTGKVFALSRDLIRSLEQDRTEDRETLPDWDTQMIPLARE